jgi:hypothetical protein
MVGVKADAVAGVEQLPGPRQRRSHLTLYRRVVSEETITPGR